MKDTTVQDAKRDDFMQAAVAKFKDGCYNKKNSEGMCFGSV